MSVVEDPKIKLESPVFVGHLSGNTEIMLSSPTFVGDVVISGFGFFYTDCYHEVPLILQSFHRTKAGAYRAMRKRMLSDWEHGFARYIEGERRFKKRQCTWYSPLVHSQYRVRPHKIIVEE